MGIANWIARRHVRKMADEVALLVYDTLCAISDSKQSETEDTTA